MKGISLRRLGFACHQRDNDLDFSLPALLGKRRWEVKSNMHPYAQHYLYTNTNIDTCDSP